MSEEDKVEWNGVYDIIEKELGWKIDRDFSKITSWSKTIFKHSAKRLKLTEEDKKEISKLYDTVEKELGWKTDRDFSKITSWSNSKWNPK